MAKRLRHRAHNIDWTPEPIRPELLHFFNLPSIGSLAQRYKNDSDLQPSFETIPFSLDRMPIRTPQPSLKIKNPSEMVLSYPLSRKAPAFYHADRSPLSGACNPSLGIASGKGNEKAQKGKGNDLRRNLDPSGTEIGSPPPLFLSQKGENMKKSATLLFPGKIPRFSKRTRSVYDARSKQIGWINTGGIIPWAMTAHTSLSKRSVLTQRKIHSNGAEASMALDGSFELAPLAMETCRKRKFSLSLLSEEIEEDFMNITGEVPLPKLNKRQKETQSQLDNLIPGMCFIEREKCLDRISA